MARRKLSTNRPARITAFAAAKINIGLRVGARRPDGYHDVCGLVHTVSLADRIEITAGEHADSGRLVRLSVPGADDLETDHNLVVRAAEALAKGRDLRPVAIVVHKTIPIAAGLGGGSADAAATLVALDVAWGLRHSPTDLIDVGAGISSDVPAILAGGLVHISGRGDHVRRLGAATDGAFVLGISPERIAAADAYAAFDALGRESAATMHHNDLERAAVELVPEIARGIDAMRAAGADPAFVTGSGPTVVGIASSLDDADLIAGRVRESFARVEVVRPSAWGVRLMIGSQGPPIN